MKSCAHKRYPDEATARRCLWAISTNRRINVDKLTVKPCKLCKGWRIARSR